MKTLIATLTLTIVLGGQCFAIADTLADDKKIKKEKTENRDLLSPELDKLFKDGKLGETVVKPMYTTTDQLVNTELIKKAKKKED